MPAQRPRAAFEPIPPDLDVTALVESTPNFQFAPRIPCESIDEQGLDTFEKLVLLHVVMAGKPLVVEGFDQRLNKSIFSEKWLRENYASKTEIARNLTNKSNLALTVGHYLKNMPLLTDQWNEHNYKDPDRQRIYLKDIDCPDAWHEQLKDLIPPSLFYLNESQPTLKAPGATSASSEHVMETSLSTAGDLMSCLPSSMRAENLMCYIGHEGTYTPSHREMCASLGHNLMVETSSGLMENGKRTKPGSSLWFMTETMQRHLVSEYWMSSLGHDIEIEDHFAQINAWKAAPFQTYVVEQQPGDFILIPPLAAHQVWNRGTRTIKVAWNRTTVDTLEMALTEAIPRARMVCRDEQYKNKAIVFYACDEYSKRLRKAEEKSIDTPEVQQLQKDFERLFSLYTQILLSESFSKEFPEKNVEYLPFDSNVTCSYCRCNIFNRFLTCPWCAGETSSGEVDPYDICMECYVMGRSCACISKLKWVEQFLWGELTEKHESWRQQIMKFKVPSDDIPAFPKAKQQLGKKTLAEICQEQLRKRPWVDITKPIVPSLNDESDLDTEDTTRAQKRRKTSRSAKWLNENTRCHVCIGFEALWKLASCTNCDAKYCYGSLFRAFNLHPQEVMEQFKWKCPKCLEICSCGACRRNPTMTPFQPTRILLGHNTRKIADPRSVESLVNFSHSNIQWLKKAGDDLLYDTPQLKGQKEVEKEHSSTPLSANDRPHIEFEEAAIPESNSYPNGFEDIPVDPALKLTANGMGQFFDQRDAILTAPDVNVDLSFVAKTALNSLH